MANFQPFHGILPQPESASLAATKPIDNYSQEEILDIIEHNPRSFLNVVIQAMLPDPSLSFRQKLLKGKVKFDQYMAEGSYLRDAAPAYYIYRHQQGHESYTGIIGLSAIDDFLSGAIKPHEQTLENKEVRLKEYLDVIDINAEPVFLTFPSDMDFKDLMVGCTAAAPGWVADAGDFGTVSVWAVHDESLIHKIYRYFQSQAALYIADGHHRTASSVFYGKTARENASRLSGKEAFNYFLTIIFPEDAIRLREFNRLVKDLNGLTVQAFLERLAPAFVTGPPGAFPADAALAVYINHAWHTLEPRGAILAATGPDKILSTQLLSDHLLAPVLGIKDLRNDKRIDFVGGQTQPGKLEKCVDSGEYAAAFYVAPVDFEQFKQFSDHGWFMPPKSTWFEPKLLNGLVVYSLNDEKIHDLEL